MFSSSRSGWLRWYREQFLGAHCHRIPPRPAYEMAHLTGETSHPLLGRSIVHFLMIWQCLQRGIPSGKRLHNYGKSPFSMGKLTISMVIFNSYVKLPEGNGNIKKQIKRMWGKSCGIEPVEMVRQFWMDIRKINVEIITVTGLGTELFNKSMYKPFAKKIIPFSWYVWFLMDQAPPRTPSTFSSSKQFAACTPGIAMIGFENSAGTTHTHSQIHLVILADR